MARTTFKYHVLLFSPLSISAAWPEDAPSSPAVSSLWAVWGSRGGGRSLGEEKHVGLTMETKYNLITWTLFRDQVCSEE